MLPPRGGHVVGRGAMRILRRTLVAVSVLVPAFAHAEDLARLELNAAENADNRCRLTFLIENKTARAIDSLKLDLALFNLDGVIQRRMVTEMGPVRGQRTNVRTFPTDGDCGQIGAILVNDVTACAPGEATACMDGLALSSRVKNVRLYK
jgi:hypothetical protein